MYYEDLSQRCDLAGGPAVRAVGYLSDEHDYSTGVVPEDFLEKLKTTRQNAWLPPIVAAGFHECELCSGEPFRDTGHILVPAGELLYIAPKMIVHYIEEHGYRPPQDFVEALMSCPAQDSAEYAHLIDEFLYLWDFIYQDKGGGKPPVAKERVSLLGILIMATPLLLAAGYFLVWPDSMIFKYLANSAILLFGTFVCIVLYEGIIGNGSFSMPCISFVIVLFVGQVLFGFFGWTATIIVMASVLVLCVIGGLLDRRRIRSKC